MTITTFTELVATYNNGSDHTREIMFMLNGMVTLEQAVLHHKVDKHLRRRNLEKVAMYVEMFLDEYEDMGIHEDTKPLLKDAGLRRSKRYGVMWPVGDGKYKYFPKTNTPAPDKPNNPGIEGILKTSETFDWTYTMSDDGNVWRRGEAAYEALIKQCKEAGLTEYEACNLQVEYWLSKGYKKPFYGMARISY